MCLHYRVPFLRLIYGLYIKIKKRYRRITLSFQSDIVFLILLNGVDSLCQS